MLGWFGACLCDHGLAKHSKGYDERGSSHFITHVNKRHLVSSVSQEILSKSLLHCATACTGTRECCSFSFSRNLKQCRLSRFCLYSPDLSEDMMEEDWIMVSRDNVLCMHPEKIPKSAAVGKCTQLGGVLASLEQYQSAHDTGYHKCSWSYLNDATNTGWLSIHVPVSGDCNSVGVYGRSQGTASVNCVYVNQSTQIMHSCWPL